MSVKYRSCPALPAIIGAAFLAATATSAQPLHGSRAFTRADTLRGSIGPERAWWNALHYDVSVRPDFATKSISGTTIIGFIATDNGLRMQIDLQQPLVVDSVTADVSKFRNGNFTIVDQRANTEREGNVLWVDLPGPMKAGEASTIRITYHGVPREAVHPPWDGGWIWKTDAQGNPWMSVACQGLGASVWYPCKDHQSDEPDDGAALHITVPDSLQAIGNGRLRNVVKNADGTSTWHWKVTNPINTYNLVPSIGKYVHFGEQFAGLDGTLDCDYWVLAYNEVKAREQFKQVAPTLACFEKWFGPYPFYADGYKLVESPYLGMEHQSAVAYGNGYRNGHIGGDRSGTGWGLKWDYVIVHETGHEWFGNSITTVDMADMWVHEGFADYSETLFIECQWGAAAASDYVVGLRKTVANDKPVIGPYGVNQEGSSDMYNKGSNLIHMIRQIIGDSTFKAMMLEMNKRFYHKLTTSAEVEKFISEFSGRDFSKVFDQYLRTTRVPELEWAVRDGDLFMRWSNCVDGFSMPANIMVNGEEHVLQVSQNWSFPVSGLRTAQVSVDRNWYVTAREAGKKAITEQEIRSLKVKAAGTP
jgi:aminopeptidase N